ncbi:MAG: diacylglycerol kinase family protein [Oscillatoriales cyanobacterium SM2_2_1]|nr:diacylglycerol kinase family protein [Oscillatoriales cyanobacterium SM2_2_1]
MTTPLFLLRRPASHTVADSLGKSFYYAGQGVLYALITQRNFRIHLAIGCVAISLSIYERLAAVELAVVLVMIGLVLAMELINTSLESVVDLTVGQDYHVLAKIAKDCAAGAVLIMAIASVSVAGLLLLPPLWITWEGDILLGQVLAGVKGLHF